MRLILAKIGNNETVNYAFDEVVRCLKKMDQRLSIDGRTYAGKEETNPQALWIGLDGSVPESELDDEIKIDVKNGAGVITGANNRAVLIAAYRFLHALGCRWIRPGSDGEVIPSRCLDSNAMNVQISETPSCRRRIVCIEGACTYEHVFNMVEWLPRIGMNGYHIQLVIPSPFFKRWYDHLHNPLREPELLTEDDVCHIKMRCEEEIKKRSLLYRTGGHGWTNDPLGLDFKFKDNDSPLITPDIRQCLAQIGGERRIDPRGMGFTHLCYSNAKVRSMITDCVVAFCKKNPQIDELNISLADGVNHHCECPECAKLRPSDYMVMILNEVDEQLSLAGIHARITFSAYVDLLWPPVSEKIKNPDRFVRGFAPITRSYSSSFYAGEKPKKVPLPSYVRNKNEMPRTVELTVAFLEAWNKQLPVDNYVFEYHLMWDHYLDPGYYSCAKLLHKDAANLDNYGLKGFVSCQEQRIAYPTALPNYALARALWDKHSNFDEICEEYYSAAFGEHGKAVGDYLAKLSELFDPKFMRNEHPEAHATALSRCDQILALVDAFEKSHILPNAHLDNSWGYLAYHAKHCKLYAELIKRYALKDAPGIEEYTKRFSRFVFENEPVLNTVFDSCMFDEVYQRWIKRVFANINVNTIDF